MSVSRHIRDLPWRALAVPALVLAAMFWAYGHVDGITTWFQAGANTRYVAPYISPLFKAAFWLVWAWLINGALRVFLWDGFARHFQRDSVPRFFRHTVSTVIFLLAIAGIFNFVLDQSLTGLWATSGVLGLVLGFATKSLIADFFSGLALSLDPPFRLGDWIMVRLPGEDPIYGRVVEMHWRLTRIQSRGRTRTISIPHSLLTSASVSQLYQPAGRVRIDVSLWLDAHIGIPRVTRILESAIVGLPGILDEPRPQVIISDTNEAGIVFTIRSWIGPDISWEVARGLVFSAALNRLAESGISTANYKRDMFFSRQPEIGTWNPEQGITEFIRNTPMFAPLSDADAADLAANTSVRWVKKGERIIEYGQPGDSMYIIREGSVEIKIGGADGTDFRAAVLHPRAFFGEMSLLTGDSRSATVVACTDSVLYEIGKSALEPLLQRHPRVAEDICNIVASRRSENTGLLDSRAAAAAAGEQGSFGAQLLARMRRFFAL